MKKNRFTFIVVVCLYSSILAQSKNSLYLPLIKTEDKTVNKAFHIAIGNIVSNVRLRDNNPVGEEKPLLFAGLEYGGVWTRDASINVWNGAGLLLPEVSKNTLMEVLLKGDDGQLTIKGQYWDKIIWSVGAWNYYLYTGDAAFLEIAYEAVTNTIDKLEKDEFDSKLNLFRGGSLIGDGIGAYDEKYTAINSFEGNVYSCASIEKWARSKDNKDKRNPQGGGLPMICLSTNCVYYRAYEILTKMEGELEKEVNPAWHKKAKKLKTAINTHLWNPKKEMYYYYIDPWNKNEYQETAGLSLAILWGIATDEQKEKIYKNIYTSPHGIPIVWPSFPRYFNEEKQTYGRFSGVIWPHAQSIYACVAALNNKMDEFAYEFEKLTALAYESKQFREIYHPTTGKPYGGLMENIHHRPLGGEPHEFGSTYIQTWSATAYLRMILMGIIGMEFSEKGIEFKPCVPDNFKEFTLLNIPYRNTIMNITISGNGNKVERFTINDKETAPFLSAKETGLKNILITVSNNN